MPCPNSSRFPHHLLRPAARIASTFLFPLLAACPGHAQTSDPALPADPPRKWIEAAAANELRIIAEDGNFPIRYSVHKVDPHSDIRRDVIETRQGTVARLIERNGKPITPQEDAAEQARLNDMLRRPDEFQRHQQHNTAAKNYSMQLVREVPKALLYTYAPGQPQTANATSPQIVIDFKPDPAYRPPAMIDNALTGIQGRVWIDRDTQHLVRLEGRVTHAVDFGWGFLARIFPGGSVDLEQTDAGGNHWTFSHLRQDLTIRQMMFKTAHQRGTMDAANFQPLPAPISYQDAIRVLLSTPLTASTAGR